MFLGFIVAKMYIPDEQGTGNCELLNYHICQVFGFKIIFHPYYKSSSMFRSDDMPFSNISSIMEPTNEGAKVGSLSSGYIQEAGQQSVRDALALDFLHCLVSLPIL